MQRLHLLGQLALTLVRLGRIGYGLGPSTTLDQMNRNCLVAHGLLLELSVNRVIYMPRVTGEVNE